MARKYLGGSGERLTVWISICASTVLMYLLPYSLNPRLVALITMQILRL